MRHFLTSKARRTLAGVAVGRVDAPATDAGRRQTLIHILVAQCPLSAFGADAEVLAAAGRKVDIGHALAAILASARLHGDLATRTHTDTQTHTT